MPVLRRWRSDQSRTAGRQLPPLPDRGHRRMHGHRHGQPAHAHHPPQRIAEPVLTQIPRGGRQLPVAVIAQRDRLHRHAGIQCGLKERRMAPPRRPSASGGAFGKDGHGPAAPQQLRRPVDIGAQGVQSAATMPQHAEAPQHGRRRQLVFGDEAGRQHRGHRRDVEVGDVIGRHQHPAVTTGAAGTVIDHLQPQPQHRQPGPGEAAPAPVAGPPAQQHRHRSGTDRDHQHRAQTQQPTQPAQRLRPGIVDRQTRAPARADRQPRSGSSG